jgi:hypothetical protein
MLLGALALLLSVDGSQSAAAAEKQHQDRPKAAQLGCPEPVVTHGKKADGNQNVGGATGSGGIRAYIDPATGQLVDTPPDSVPAPQLPADGVKTPVEEPVEIQSPVPGGGIKVDLKGRFRGPLTATVGPDGKIVIQHKPCDEHSDPKRQ